MTKKGRVSDAELASLIKDANKLIKKAIRNGESIVRDGVVLKTMHLIWLEKMHSDFVEVQKNRNAT